MFDILSSSSLICSEPLFSLLSILFYFIYLSQTFVGAALGPYGSLFTLFAHDKSVTAAQVAKEADHYIALLREKCTHPDGSLKQNVAANASIVTFNSIIHAFGKKGGIQPSLFKEMIEEVNPFSYQMNLWFIWYEKGLTSSFPWKFLHCFIIFRFW